MGVGMFAWKPGEIKPSEAQKAELPDVGDDLAHGADPEFDGDVLLHGIHDPSTQNNIVAGVASAGINPVDAHGVGVAAGKAAKTGAVRTAGADMNHGLPGVVAKPSLGMPEPNKERDVDVKVNPLGPASRGGVPQKGRESTLKSGSPGASPFGLHTPSASAAGGNPGTMGLGRVSLELRQGKEFPTVPAGHLSGGCGNPGSLNRGDGPAPEGARIVRKSSELVAGVLSESVDGLAVAPRLDALGEVDTLGKPKGLDGVKDPVPKMPNNATPLAFATRAMQVKEGHGVDGEHGRTFEKADDGNGVGKGWSPSLAQIEANNYPHKHRRFQGLDVAIENATGTTRSGVDKDGKPWETVMKHDYGYIVRTK